MAIEALHARYPFLAAAREAVGEADVDLADLVAERGPAVERAIDRVQNAIESGSVGDGHPAPRVELLSYPVARVLVSLVDEPGLTHRYARAEAATAAERIAADLADATDLRSVSRERIGLDALRRDLDLATAVTETPDGFEVGVAAYLRLTDELSGERWGLGNRALSGGTVAVSREEGFDLLREAIRARVATGLPLDVPDEVAASLSDAVADLHARIAELDPDWDIDAVEPALFPPCIAALAEQVDAGDDLPAHSRFALASFLSTIGADAEALRERHGIPDYAIDHLRGEDGRSVYPPPSCATMQAYGDCVNMDAVCETIVHPLDYYEKRLRGDDAALDDA